MKVSLGWLRELVALPEGTDAAAVARALTEQGLEIESMEARGRDLRGVLVAEILAVRAHPNADKLRLVRVRAGSREEEVVCGARNVPGPGGKVCWAPPGAILPGGFTLEAREVRGVLSPGMLCSEKELGFGTGVDGILILSPTAPLGADLALYVGAVDDVLEVNVTPNRPDALSHIGIARELAAHFGVALRWPEIPKVVEVAQGPTIDAQITDPAACPRYLARFVTGLTVGPSPLAMRLRLEACGMRAISNLVDVTNYVLLETGHPLHAFDFEKIAGGIVVRRARFGERMTTIDGQDRALLEDDVVIADGQGPVALAGVMGGATSEVSGTTRQVLLEAATFDPVRVRRTAKRLNLRSEASYRFERGVDANGIPYAANRAAALLAQLGDGQLVSGVVDRYVRPSVPRKMKLSTSKLRRLTGIDYDAKLAADKLHRLGFACEVTADEVVTTAPTFRSDILIEEDLIEEVLRMGEYGRPARHERVLTNATSRPNPELPADRARDLLAAAGLHEIAGWGFVSRAALERLSGSEQRSALAPGVRVKNPISADYEVMRTSLLPGLIDALRRNLARGLEDAWLFEVGPIVRPKAGTDPEEPTYAAGLLAGKSPGWLKPGEPVDFYDAKRIVEDLLRGFGVAEASYVPPAPAPFVHPGVSASVRLSDGSQIGLVGEIHPVIGRRLGLEIPAFYFEMSVDKIANARGPVRTVAPPRFPAVTRDVSFWIDQGVTAAEQKAAFLASSEPLLRDLAVLEDFRDPRYVPAGQKGMLWSMTYRAEERTLTDEEADAAHARVVAALSERKKIQIR